MRSGVFEMNRTKRRLLILALAMLAVLTVQCSEKEGPISPYPQTEPPPYRIASLEVTPVRVEPGEQATVTALVLDRSDDPVADYEVVFQASIGAIASPVMTDQNGHAVATFTAPGSTGTATITAGAEGTVPRDVVVQIGQGILSVNPASILADGVSTSTLSVTVVGSAGKPQSGVSVVFETDEGTINGATTVTDAEGVASAVLVSESSHTDLTANVTATITMLGSPRTEIALVEMRGISVAVTADPTKVPADGISASIVQARVSETTSGAPLVDRDVVFSASMGAITGSATTDDAGVALAILTSSAEPGVATVGAEFGGVSDFTNVSFGILSLSAAAAYPKMVADGTSSEAVVATLVTESNNPVTGVEIDFSTTAGIIAKSAITDSRGSASVLLTCPAHEATAEVIVSFKGMYADTLEVEFENPLLVLRPLPISITAGSATGAKILAYVSFADLAPVPDNTRVRFVTTQGAITSSALTSSGIATAQLVPNGVADDHVVVSAACGSATATTQMVFTADAPSKVLCHALPDTVASGGTSFATIVAQVTDAFGNPVEDGTLVTFSMVAGNGLVTPSGLTSGGTATARFTPSGGGVARVRATCETKFADAGIVVLSQLPGAIVADPDTAWISCGDTQDRTQAVVTAHVFDSYMNPVDEGSEVVFEISTGPGGGEYLDDPSFGYGPITKLTSGGMASVTVNSGTKPGTLMMMISAGGRVATSVKVGISSGLPDSIFITTGEVVTGSDGVYVLAVSAIVRDKFMNPVENGTAVYFTLDRPDIGLINPEAATGGIFPCEGLTATPNKGVAHACLKFPTKSMTQGYSIMASCGDRASTFAAVIPIVLPATLNLGAVPGSVSAATGGTVDIFASLSDQFALPIEGATVSFTVEGVGTVDPAFATTDVFGSCQTVITVPAGVEPGTTKVKASVFMTDIQSSLDLVITP